MRNTKNPATAAAKTLPLLAATAQLLLAATAQLSVPANGFATVVK